MKHFLSTTLVLLIFFSLFADAADTLRIAPCDEAVRGIFGDLTCLSRDEGVLRRYVNGQLSEIYSGERTSQKQILQDPLRPVQGGTDNLFILDAGTKSITTWDRFLNIHSITTLEDDILSPGAFTVTSEHDWLIYDTFFAQIFQIHSGENFYINWGDKPVSGEIDLFSVERQVFIYLKDQRVVRKCDEEGKTQQTWTLPEHLPVYRIFPLSKRSIALCAEEGVYLWDLQQEVLHYLSDLKDVVFCGTDGTSYILINKNGVVVTIP